MIYEIDDTSKTEALFEGWKKLIEDVYPDAKKVTRYAIKKDTQFDVDSLQKNLLMLPEGYELKEIDSKIYDICLKNPVTYDFVSSFGSKEKYPKENVAQNPITGFKATSAHP